MDLRDTLNRTGSSWVEKAEDSDDTSNKRAMFGDAFGSRGDYSKGFFYGGRRKVLQKYHIEDKINELELPEMFKTRQQTRKLRKKTEEFQFKLEFGVNLIDETAAKQAKQAVKKQEEKKSKKAMKSAMLVIEHYSSTEPSDWTATEQAGCKFYVNRKTGEATSEKPWELSPREQPNKKPSFLLPPINSPVKQQSSKPPPPKEPPKDAFECAEEGTGSVVYNGDELKSFLTILDEHCEAQSKLNAKKKR